MKRPSDAPDTSEGSDASAGTAGGETRAASGEPSAPAAGGGEAEEIARLKQEAHQAQDRYLRALAEFENTKKRLHREKEEFARFASEAMARELLPIVDSLDQAVVAVDPSTRPASAGLARDSAPQDTAGESGRSAGLRRQIDVQAVVKGVQLIRQQLARLLEREGVQRIASVGEPFDPHKHEAVAQVEAGDGTAENTVVEEVRVGYLMHDKVLRPAMVKVAHKRADSVQRIADSGTASN